MTFNLDIINIFLLIVAVITLSLGVIVFMADRKNYINKYFFVFTLCATLWTTAMFFARNFAGLDNITIFLRILYASAALIPFSFIFFIDVFPDGKSGIKLKHSTLLAVPLLIMLGITMYPNILIKSSFVPSIGQEQIIIFNRLLHIIYAMYISIYFTICYTILIIKYYRFSGVEKTQITYVLIGTFLSTIIGLSTNLLMPILNDFSLNWLGQIGIIVMVCSVSYSILKHKLFNLKIILTQFFIFLLSISLFIRVLLSSGSSDLIVNIVYLLFSIILGSFLIQSVMNEVKQKEKVEDLANNLLIANEKLKELDQMKSEFLSLATHQIRAPLTAIKGYASLILEGDYGVIPEKVKSAVSTIFESCQNLVLIVNDFLDISRIEQGRMKYDKTEFDIVKICSDILNQLKPNIENAGLKYSFDKSLDQAIVFADIGKIKQIIGNVIDNSIKYTKTGDINLNIKKVGENALISVKDTGVGISKEDIPKLFAKFVRAKDASKTNVIGTGLGLYIAKQMLEAQGGKIWVESEGLGKGSTFFIQIPIKIN